MNPPTIDHSDISAFSEPRLALKNKFNAGETEKGPSSSQEIVIERNELVAFEYGTNPGNESHEREGGLYDTPETGDMKIINSQRS